MKTAYKISNLPPPCYAEAVKAFGVDFDKGVVFTYGDTIHLRHPELLTQDLIVHECTHIKQQAEIGGPEKWWDLYIKNKNFRLHQELEAYKNQYQYVLRNENKRKHFSFLKFYAESLCKIYALDISVHQAMNLIKKEPN